MAEYASPYPRIEPDALKITDRDGGLLRYEAHPDLVAAANAALAVERPLLLTGEAGCGKTDFARAVAHALLGTQDKLESCYVRSDSRARDLLYEYDSLRRYGDAQTEDHRARAQDPRTYVDLKPLGRALLAPTPKPDVPNVVLIDEIDKAPRDLPNDLLQEIDQGFFEIQELSDSASAARASAIDIDDHATYRFRMAPPSGALRPFTIITSNVERQLPDPFLRRCVFFHIPFPEEESLRAILRSRFAGQPAELISDTVSVFMAFRGVSELTKKPSTSELIDWFRVLTKVHVRDSVQAELKALVAKLDPKRPSDSPWRDIPALPCLVKLREDLLTLNALPGSPA